MSTMAQTTIDFGGNLEDHLDTGILKGFLSLHSEAILKVLGRGIRSLSALV